MIELRILMILTLLQVYALCKFVEQTNTYMTCHECNKNLIFVSDSQTHESHFQTLWSRKNFFFFVLKFLTAQNEFVYEFLIAVSIVCLAKAFHDAPRIRHFNPFWQLFAELFAAETIPSAMS